MANRKVTEKVIKDIMEDVKHWYGIVLTELQACLIILNHEEVRKDWNEVGSSTDTVFREKVLNAIVKECGVKKKWPTASAPKNEMQAFQDEFLEKAKKYGFEIEKGFNMVE